MGFVSSGIREAILIHRDGTFLGRHPLVNPSPVDWAAQARALIDLMDAVGASFDSAPEQLRDLQFEDLTLHLEVGDQLILVSIVEGRVRPALARRVRACLVDVEMNFHAALASWDGRPERFAGIDRMLRGLVDG